jgi:hypothetical protein
MRYVTIVCRANLAMLFIVPHICSTCGHAACGPCCNPIHALHLIIVHKWLETSTTCPQCRAKLSTANSLVRDFTLERVADKYAKSALSALELVDRETQTTYHPYLLK